MKRNESLMIDKTGWLINKEIREMTAKEMFECEVSALEEQAGSKAKTRTYQVLSEVVRWLRQSGHGNVTLSAVNNYLGAKIRTETIISVDSDNA